MKASNKNNQRAKNFKGLNFLGFVVFLYVILYFVNSTKTLKSIEHFIKNTWTVLPIFLIVILISAIINYFFPTERLSKILQEKSGFQTYLVSLLAGSISMGPLFSWFPLLKNLKEKGLKDGVLVTFIYAKSIKLTLLPIMIGFFGQVYTIIFMLFIAVAAVIQGLLYEFIAKKN